MKTKITKIILIKLRYYIQNKLDLFDIFNI